MKNKNKFIIVVIIILSLSFPILSSIIKKGEKDIPIENSFIQCLKDNGVVIYGTETCPSCKKLVENFGGYDVINPIYVNCTKESLKCSQEIKSGYVPEIQINGVVYSDSREMEEIGKEVGCLLN